MAWEWERLDEATYRAKVICGWLVLHRFPSKSESMEFVADRDHEWTIVPPIHEEQKDVKVLADHYKKK